MASTKASKGFKVWTVDSWWTTSCTGNIIFGIRKNAQTRPTPAGWRSGGSADDPGAGPRQRVEKGHSSPPFSAHSYWYYRGLYIYIGLSHYPTVFALLPHVTFTLRYWRDQLNSIHIWIQGCAQSSIPAKDMLCPVSCRKHIKSTAYSFC